MGNTQATITKCINRLNQVIENIDVTIAVESAYLAGDAIMDVYNSADFGLEIKSDDSPLTLADKRAHTLIVKHLKETNIPILSEEGDSISYQERRNWPLFWMVDPLDGTKEFIKRNGEFTVNIALIKQGMPIFGVVYSPVLEKMYFGGNFLENSFVEEKKQNCTALSKYESKNISFLDDLDIVRIIASRSHQSIDDMSFIDQYSKTELMPMGSSLKFIVLAEGKADVYPRYAPCMEWDTAAAHAILQGVGMDIYQMDGNKSVTNNSLIYNKENLLNPNFISY